MAGERDLSEDSGDYDSFDILDDFEMGLGSSRCSDSLSC